MELRERSRRGRSAATATATRKGDSYSQRRPWIEVTLQDARRWDVTLRWFYGRCSGGGEAN
jgi:hypothetical protein